MKSLWLLLCLVSLVAALSGEDDGIFKCWAGENDESAYAVTRMLRTQPAALRNVSLEHERDICGRRFMLHAHAV